MIPESVGLAKVKET